MRDQLLATGDHAVELIPGATGAFEITIEGQLRYSKIALGRFPEDEEIDALISG